MYADDIIMLSPFLKGLQSMFNLRDAYAKTHFLIFNAKKTFLMSVGRHRFVSAHLFLNQQPVMWTDKFRYLGVQFLCGNTIDFVPVKRQFYAACNSILARSSGTCEPVKVQLVKSYCLPLLVYCIGALRLKRSTVQHLSVCWNDAFRTLICMTFADKIFGVLC